MNLKRWREYNLEFQFLNFIEKYDGSVPHHDQGLINGVCKGSILVIDPKYNMMPQFFMYSATQIRRLFNIVNYYSQKQLNEATEMPVIIHYISKFYNRPWFEDCTHPMKGKYENYLNETNWPIKIYESNTNYKVKLRKWLFNNMPFVIFSFIERVLDIKRKRYFKRRYNHLNVLK